MVLFASGGLLALHKCYWWLISWDWNQDLPVPRSPAADSYTVGLSSGNDTAPVEIKRLSLDEWNVGLGYRLAPSGCLLKEFQHRKSLSDKMSSRVNATTLSPEEAWTLWGSIFVPKIFYPSKSDGVYPWLLDSYYEKVCSGDHSTDGLQFTHCETNHLRLSTIRRGGLSAGCVETRLGGTCAFLTHI